jgi:hypothetical protein
MESYFPQGDFRGPDAGRRTGQFPMTNQAASRREQLQAGFVGGGAYGIKHGGDTVAAGNPSLVRALVKITRIRNPLTQPPSPRPAIKQHRRLRTLVCRNPRVRHELD